MARSHFFFDSGALSPAFALRPASPPPYLNSNNGSYFSTQPHCARLNLTRRPAVETAAINGSDGARVYVVSDLHTDYSENMSWLSSLLSHNDRQSVLLVAGDVAETHKNFVVSMSILRDKFDRVFFVPGNHDLWLRREKTDYLSSLDKLDKLLEACEQLGVETKPSMVDGVGIIPLYSWYHESFDEERDITGIRIPSLAMACKDYHVCKWPDELKNGDTSLAMYFDSLNDENSGVVEDILKKCTHIISFSHFLPRQELCPEKRMLFYPNLPKVIGSTYLEKRIRAIHGADRQLPACHVFGHTHFCWDAVLEGIRYVQAPLAYPRERKRRMNGGDDWLPFCIYSSGNFSEKLSPCYWSDHYSANPRTPDVTELAPWVARYYSKV
ncbi:acyl-carrier-protein phosphodiesterase PptH-like [Salvia splendens]|uniref:acyl-carrier-protein phosphodiesterase PptH-like n=1 Tax=Salvia splendens TaxID=180675 RepID=UPI001C26CA0C|nr:acyl-carrier-protein phosphodiesterase PptH-like [Salvia splendens]